MPGVRLVLTGAGHRRSRLSAMHGRRAGTEDGRPALSGAGADEVRHVGDAVAFVVADTLEQARDAAEAIEIEWEALPHVVGAEAALEQGAPQVWPDRPGNLAFEVTFGDRGANASGLRQGRARSSRSRSSTSGSSPTISTPAAAIARIRRGERSRHADAWQPGPARDPRRHRRARAEDPARQDARGHAGRRRRLRHQAVLLSRIRAGRGRGEEDRSAR